MSTINDTWKSASSGHTQWNWGNSDNTWRHHIPLPRPPALEVIRGRWTSPVTPLQPLPTPGGPFRLKSIQSSIQSAEIRMRATSIQHSRHELKWRHRGRASGATPDLENHFWDPTFVRRVDLGQEGASLAENKEASLTSSPSWLHAENVSTASLFSLDGWVCFWSTLALAATFFFLSKVNFAWNRLLPSSFIPPHFEEEEEAAAEGVGGFCLSFFFFVNEM